MDDKLSKGKISISIYKLKRPNHKDMVLIELLRRSDLSTINMKGLTSDKT